MSGSLIALLCVVGYLVCGTLAVLIFVAGWVAALKAVDSLENDVDPDVPLAPVVPISPEVAREHDARHRRLHLTILPDPRDER